MVFDALALIFCKHFMSKITIMSIGERARDGLFLTLLDSDTIYFLS